MKKFVAPLILLAAFPFFFLPSVVYAQTLNPGQFSTVTIGSGYYSASPVPANGMIVQGNVGIGTPAPGNTADINGGLTVRNAGGNAIGGTTTYGNVDLTLGGTVSSTSNAYGLYSGDMILGLASTGYSATFGYFNGTVNTNGYTVTNAIDLDLEAMTKTGGGTIINTYGIYVNPSAIGTYNYAAYFGGSVGIGTPSPGAYELNVQQAGSNQAYFGSTGSHQDFVTLNTAVSGQGAWLLFSDAGTVEWYLGKNSTQNFSLYDPIGNKIFINAASEGNLTLGAAGTFAINQAGNVGVGIASPQNLLDVNGAASIGYNVAAPSNGLIVSGKVAIGTTTPASSYIGFDVFEPIIRFGQSSYPANYPPNAACPACTYLVLDAYNTGGFNDASVVFRDNGNLRGEIGLIGDDSLHFRTSHGFYSAGTDATDATDRMIILGSSAPSPAMEGFVGIGANFPPIYPFEVHLAPDRNFAINNSSNLVHIFGENDAGTASEDLAFGYNNDQLYLTAGDSVFVNYSSSQNTCCSFQVNSQIYATSTSIISPSDNRLKTDIAPLGDSLPIIMALNPVSYEFLKNQLTPAGAKLAAQQKAAGVDPASAAGKLQPKPDVYNFPAGTQIGFIAQDVAEATKNTPYLSALVGVPADQSSDYYTLQEGNMIPLLVKAIQEQQAEIDELKQTNSAMKAKFGM